MKPRSKKSKGSKFEKKIMQALNNIGWKARKQPGSGIYSDFPHDVYAEHPVHGKFIIECKKHKSPSKTFNRWIGKADLLVVEANYEDPYVYMTWAAFESLTRVDE